MARPGKLRVVFGTKDAAFAWGLAALSGFFAWMYLHDADLSGWRYRHVETAEAVVEYCERTKHYVGGVPRSHGGGAGTGTPIFKHTFAFTDGRTGAKVSGASYATGACIEPGRAALVEYPPGEPARARMVGQRAKPYSPLLPLLLCLLPAAGFWVAGFVLARGLGWIKVPERSAPRGLPRL